MAINEQVVLIRIARSYRPRMPRQDLYEATRKWWVMDARRDPDYAFAVHGGRVKAVYAIDRWERSGDGRRRAFHGSEDEAMSRRYLDADVSEYFPRGFVGSTRFVNC
jgi:hypothetical protein